MQFVVVLYQLVDLLNRALSEATRGEDLANSDFMAMAWLRTLPGSPCATTAARLGVSRQNLQRTLERLERYRLAERRDSAFTQRTVGWALTEPGHACLHRVEQRLECVERNIASEGRVDCTRLALQLELVLRAIVQGRVDFPIPGHTLVEPPAPVLEPDWDP